MLKIINNDPVKLIASKSFSDELVYLQSHDDMIGVSAGKILKIYNIDTFPNEEEIFKVLFKEEVWRLEFHPQGECVAVASVHGNVVIHSLIGNCAPKFLPSNTLTVIQTLRFSLCGSNIIVTFLNGDVMIWDTMTAQLCQKFNCGNIISALIVCPESSDLLLGVFYGELSVFSVQGLYKSTFKVTTHITCLVIVENVVVVGLEDGRLQKISFQSSDNIAGSKQLWSASPHLGWIYTITLSPDETMIATSSSDKTCKIISFETGEVLFSLSGHTGLVKGVCFNSQGTRIFTCSSDKSVKVWSLFPKNHSKIRALVNILVKHCDDPTTFLKLALNLKQLMCSPTLQQC